MSAKIRVYHSLVYEKDGESASIGNPGVTLGEVSSPGTYFNKGELVPIAPQAAKMVWEYTRARDFEILEFLIPKTGGYLNLALFVDTPVSALDLNPSGTNPRWRQFDLSCKCPLTFNTDQAILLPILADDVGSLGNGLPKVFTDGAKVTAKVYKAAVFNPALAGTADVELIVRHLN